MEIIFELSKEHPTLPQAEALACLQAEAINYSILDRQTDILILDADITEDTLQRLAERLAMSFFLDKYIFSSAPDLKAIKTEALNHHINETGSLAVYSKNRSSTINSRPLLKSITDVYTHDKRVDLKNPDIAIRMYITNDQVYVGIKKAAINRKQFEQRKVQHRPFFSPISLHPKLARTLVNLSQIQRNNALLDPFCGTGGILLEAGLLGAKIIGNDIEEHMIKGCKKTFDH